MAAPIIYRLIFFGLGGLAPCSLALHLLDYYVYAGVYFLIFFTFIIKFTFNGGSFGYKCAGILGILIIPGIIAVHLDLR